MEIKKMLNIKKWNYGNYSSNNYGAHSLAFQLGDVTVYFSYETPVAFEAPGHGLVVRVNDWGPTSGKHLNWIDGGDHKNRLPGSEFEPLLKKVAGEDPDFLVDSNPLGLASKVSKLYEVLDGGKDPASVNKWQKKFFEAGVPGISFPDDWDELPEAEKERRLQGVIKEGLTNG
jgi:hypothetical protein